MGASHLEAFLAKTVLFSALPSDALAAVAPALERRPLAKGETLFDARTALVTARRPAALLGYRLGRRRALFGGEASGRPTWMCALVAGRGRARGR